MSITNETTEKIITFLQWNGHHAERTNTGGRRSASGKYVRFGAPGQGDITAILKPYGRHMEIEVKTGDDKQSEDQKKREARLRSMGALYVLTGSLDEFIKWYNSYIKLTSKGSL